MRLSTFPAAWESHIARSSRKWISWPGEGVRKAYEEVLVPAGMGDVAIFTELGRYMLGPNGCLVTKAIHEKHIYKEYIEWTPVPPI